MVKDTGAKFRFLTACSFKKAVVNDKSINTFVICERLYLIGDFLLQERRKPQPVRLWAVQKTIKRILGE